ncbi:MAG TPA: ROK family protein [Longimicrobiales bacterium]|nr:ROK family protein [Longimicrobiales bacterium]
MSWIVGVDIGGTNLAVGLVPETGGDAVALRNRATRAERGVEVVVDDIARMARSAMESAGIAETDVIGMGVGSPGPLDRATGVVSESPNLGWRDVPLRQLLRARFDAPVALDNDANCAVYGEWWQGAGRGSASMFGLTVGTGIGGGWISDGVLQHGVSDAAGEIGHTTVAIDGRLCACGNYGCLEAYASGPSIARRARQGVEAGTDSALLDLVDGELDRITAVTVFEAAVSGDAFADRVVNEAARTLGVGVANIINLLNPEIVVLMGGVTRAGDHLLQPLRAEVRTRAFRVAAEACRIVPGTLVETAGVVGAAGLFLQARRAGLVAT